nr:MAG TPA: hypothetical protein [Caudoviricetes sp.]
MSSLRQTVQRIWSRRIYFVSHGRMKRKRKGKLRLQMQRWRG